MDAVAVNEVGIPYFFKGGCVMQQVDGKQTAFRCVFKRLILSFLSGDHLFKGFHGEAELSNETFAELDDYHHLGHVDAAFRMHFEKSTDHDHMFFFLVRLTRLYDEDRDLLSLHGMMSNVDVVIAES